MTVGSTALALCKEAGATDYLLKPYERAKMIGMVEQYCGLAPGQKTLSKPVIEKVCSPGSPQSSASSRVAAKGVVTPKWC